MGRRKLPSLPPQRSEKTSEGLPPPIYLTSSAPLYPSESERFTAAQEQSAFTRTKVRTSSYNDLNRPSSANSVLSNADFHTTIDPTIIPGAAIAGVKPKLRQTSSAVTGGKPTSLLAQPTKYKMPTTLARVLLKKELKEALEKRRETLEACEIEANQRQYVVRRMLLTGLLPESRPAEIDDIPNVIPCLLPIELISGANVIPTTSSSMTTAKRSSENKCCYTQSQPSTSKTQSIAISTDDIPRRPLRAKSVGVQVEESECSSELSSPISMRTFTALQKDKAFRHCYSNAMYSTTPKFISTETQTEGLSTHDRRRNKSTMSNSASRRKPSKKMSSSDTNLLETTAKYFAEYDRQLREHGRLMRHRFTFADDDPIKRETKKQQLIDELARRKEKISSMIDLSTATDYPTDHGPSDYSTTVPHYGSLPRMDFTTNARPLRYREHYNSYNSLPRNYERYRDTYDYLQPDYDFVQPPQISSARYDALTRSLNDLHFDSEDNIIDPRMRPSATRSLDYLGRPLYEHWGNSRFASPVRRNYPYHPRRYAADDLNAQHFHPYDGLQTSGKPDMISQYANFLNNQFRTDQEEQLLRERHLGAQSYSTSPYSTNVPLSNHYNAPLSDPYPLYRGSHLHTSSRPYASSTFNNASYETPYQETHAQFATYPPQYSERSTSYNTPGPYNNSRFDRGRMNATYPPPFDNYDYAAAQPHLLQSTSDYRSEMYPRELCQVYSRNETNYGSRPLQNATDYGNFYRNRPPPVQPYDPYDEYIKERFPRNNGLQDRFYDTYNTPSISTAPGGYAQNRQNISGTTFTTPLYNNGNRCNRSEPYNISLNKFGTTRNNSGSTRYGKSWPLYNSYDESYPQEDALTQMYATAGGSYRSPRTQHLADISNRNHVSSLGRYDKKHHKSCLHSERETQSAHVSEESDNSYEVAKKNRRCRRGQIKQILLNRRYRDSNIYNDLGIRITGGKKLQSGELGAFVSAVNKERASETLGELKEGDQVLEWNGVILTGKTFEEVERIVNGSQGEIELVVKSGAEEMEKVMERKHQLKNSNVRYHEPNRIQKRSAKVKRKGDTDTYAREAPPIPTHRCVDGRASPSFDMYPSLSILSEPTPAKAVTKTYRASGSDPHSLGYINIAVSYNYRSSTLRVTVLSARGLSYRQHSSKTFYPNPFVKIYLLPGREVCNKRRTKFVSNTADPVWNQIVEYNIPLRDLRSHYLEFTVWDYDRLNDNNSLGQVIISLSEPSLLDGTARWYPLQSMQNNFAVTGLPSSHFQNVIGNYSDTYAQNNYNPASLDIGYPVIN